MKKVGKGDEPPIDILHTPLPACPIKPKHA